LLLPFSRDGNYDLDLIDRSLHNVEDLSQVGAFLPDHPFGGVTPLYAAAHFGHAAAVNILLKAGANPNLVLYDGRSALQTAVGRVGQFLLRANFLFIYLSMK